MNWLARLKSLESPDDYPTKPTKPSNEPVTGGFVGFVGYPPGRFEKCNAANPPVTGAAAQACAGPPAGPPRCATPQQVAQSSDSDAWCWPHGSAMNRAEVRTFIARVRLFGAKGVPGTDADRLAVALVERDRTWDERSVCMECVHLHGIRRWRCLPQHHHGPVGWDCAQRMQRCPGFDPHEL